jgi:hypothetical protein
MMRSITRFIVVLTTSLAVRCVLAGALLSTLVLGAIALYLGSAWLVVPFLRGDRYVVCPLSVDLGECEPGATPVARFTATSLSRRPCRIVGSVEQCSCLTTDKLPISLDPFKGRVISIKVFMPKVPADFSQSALLYFDDGELGTVNVRITGRTARKSSVAAARLADNKLSFVFPTFSTAQVCPN